MLCTTKANRMAGDYSWHAIATFRNFLKGSWLIAGRLSNGSRCKTSAPVFTLNLHEVLQSPGSSINSITVRSLPAGIKWHELKNTGSLSRRTGSSRGILSRNDRSTRTMHHSDPVQTRKTHPIKNGKPVTSVLLSLQL